MSVKVSARVAMFAMILAAGSFLAFTIVGTNIQTRIVSRKRREISIYTDSATQTEKVADESHVDQIGSDKSSHRNEAVDDYLCETVTHPQTLKELETSVSQMLEDLENRLLRRIESMKQEHVFWEPPFPLPQSNPSLISPFAQDGADDDGATAADPQEILQKARGRVRVPLACDRCRKRKVKVRLHLSHPGPAC